MKQVIKLMDMKNNERCHKLVGVEVIRIDNKQFDNGKYTSIVESNDGETLILKGGTRVPCNECKELNR